MLPLFILKIKKLLLCCGWIVYRLRVFYVMILTPGVSIAIKGWLTLGTKLWKSAEPEMQFLPEKPSLDRIHWSSLWPSRSNSSTGAFSTYKRGGQLRKMTDVPLKMWTQGSMKGKAADCPDSSTPTFFFSCVCSSISRRDPSTSAGNSFLDKSSWIHRRTTFSFWNLKIHPMYVSLDHLSYLQVLQSGQQVNSVWHELLQRDPQLHPFLMVVVQRAFKVVR